MCVCARARARVFVCVCVCVCVWYIYVGARTYIYEHREGGGVLYPALPSALCSCWLSCTVHFSGRAWKTTREFTSTESEFPIKESFHGVLFITWQLPLHYSFRKALKRVFEKLTKGRRGNVSQAFSTAFTCLPYIYSW